MPWFFLIAVAVSLGLSYFSGRNDGAADCQRERANLVVIWKQEVERQRLLADDIDRKAAVREREHTRKLKETQYALSTATRGRACLGTAALRVLDHAVGLRPPTPAEYSSALPGATASAAADPAREGADEGGDYATDTDVAGWIATAAGLYEHCRGRIDDLRRYAGGA